MTFNTIQPIGKKPDTTPSSEARIDMPAGIVNTKIAMMIGDDARAMMAAMCALTLPLAIKHQQRDDGYRRGDGRQCRIAKRII